MFLKRFVVLVIISLSLTGCLSLPEKWLSDRTTSLEHQYNLKKSDIKDKTIDFLSIHFKQGMCNIQTDDNNRMTGSFTFVIDEKYATYCTTNFIMNLQDFKLQYKLIVQDVYISISSVTHYSEYVWGNFEEQINTAVHNLDKELDQFITNN